MKYQIKVNDQQIKLITCPEEQTTSRNTLFLAGGISNCPDWQSDLIKLIDKLPITTLNPRRLSFDTSNPSATDFQIAWEHRHLHIAETISFWFPKETECPITLFELGYWLLSSKPLIIGADPDYIRIQEIFAYLAIHRPELRIDTTLKDLALKITSVGKSNFNVTNFPIKNEEIYLAGGISDCPNWQIDLNKELTERNILVFNPRTDNFMGKGGLNYRKILQANHQRFLDSKAIVFWFPKSTLNSMALFELGIACQLNKPIFIGVEPGYQREQDIHVQVGLARPEVNVVNSLEQLVEQLCL